MIHVRELYHSYGHNDTYQVKNVSFDITRGEIFGFLGPNGAGKSTTQKIMTGLLPLQRGYVELAGQDMGHIDRQIFNKIGVAFEQANLYGKLTGLENLQFHAGLYGVPTIDPMALLIRLDLEEAANKRVSTYSKGMQQRLALARSLLNNPEILFLDEPTSGLDPSSARSVKELIREKQTEGVTIFLTTHDMHVAEELCNRVAFINAGEIVALDSPRELKLRYGERTLLIENRVNGHIESLILDQNKDDDRRHLLALMQAGSVETVHSQEATLEAVFIALTGRGLD